MAGQKKMTVKSVNNELEVVKEQLKEMQDLVEDLKNEIKSLKSKENVEQSTEVKCRKCQESFASQQNLNEHIRRIHSKNTQCLLCDQTLSSNSDIESHADQHGLEKKFKCEVCDKDIYLEWRLEKHKRVHEGNIKPCRYFISHVECPFEKIGCKFKHGERKDLPQNHVDANLEEDDDIETLQPDENDDDAHDENDYNDDPDENEKEIVQCVVCFISFGSKEEMVTHCLFNHPRF